MAICPFATWHPITGGVGPYTSGPFKIVHHTTEGSTAAGAFDAFADNRSDPHFTVDANTIFQHINTASAARSLRNDPGGVQTNKDSALQIEVVGFAHLAKNANTLKNVARLCRWLEAQHQVVLAWPNGLPKVATPNGHDPGGHNRNPVNWETKSGHYGHCHVPENTHWDPGYTAAEVQFLMEAEFDDNGDLRNVGMMQAHGAILERTGPQPAAAEADFGNTVSTMPDHHHRSAEDEFELY